MCVHVCVHAREREREISSWYYRSVPPPHLEISSLRRREKTRDLGEEETRSSKNSERVGRRHAVCERKTDRREKGAEKKEMEKEEENSETTLSQRILLLI